MVAWLDPLFLPSAFTSTFEAAPRVAPDGSGIPALWPPRLTSSYGLLLASSKSFGCKLGERVMSSPGTKLCLYIFHRLHLLDFQLAALAIFTTHRLQHQSYVALRGLA